MAITPLSNNLNIIQALSDEPNDTGTNPLTTSELKAKFDEAANIIKSWINDILVPNLTASGISFTSSAAISATNIQDAIEEVHQEIADAAAAEIVDGSITAAKLALALWASLAQAQAGEAINVLMTPANVKAYVDYIKATQTDAEAGTSDDKWMTPLTTRQLITYILATQAEAEAGVNTSKLMTPIRAKQAALALKASEADAETGTSETKLMTPLSTKQAIDAFTSPAEVATATWNESLAASSQVIKTISHTLGALPSKLIIRMISDARSSEIIMKYNGSSYDTLICGAIQDLSNYNSTSYWTPAMVTSNYIFGRLSTFYCGGPAIGNLEFQLRSVSVTDTQVSFTIYNNSSSSHNISSNVTMEVYK